MELLLIVLVTTMFSVAAGRRGFDSRPTIYDEPRRAI